jgi:hypothetical protein
VTKLLPRSIAFLLLSALFDSVAAAQGFTVVLPAAASLHGLAPAFFHSDAVVFNRSAVRTAVVRATYRCIAGPCGSSPQVFSVAPRQLHLIEDIVATLFGAPETSGAIEFSSTEPIVVTSRLYSPARPGPTLGMLVPGLGPDRAFASSDLVNLSHSHDPSVGFRTNIGVFNPGDQARTVNIRCIDTRGSLGFINQVVGPHQLFQINDGDLFREFSILRTASTFSCFVSGGAPFLPLYSWAAVIDNQSNDATFVIGQQFFTPPRILVLPAAASLHGGAGTFFRTDLAVFNDDVVGDPFVTARYRCFLGSCTESAVTFDVGPGATAIFSDAVATLFGAPESAGWIELIQSSQHSGRISVTSRLYTPGPDRGTVGMSVPALEPRDGPASQVLPLLTNGSRVNVGVINPENAAQVVTIRVFSRAGERLGRVKRLLLAKQATQINDVFHELGLPGDVDAAYVLVEGSSPPFRIFAYAAIIDNASQDPIFVPGQDDPEGREVD